MTFHVVTLFPEIIDAYTGASILGRAQKDKKIKVKTYQLRNSAGNKWGKVDERPYGGGPGMVLRAEPVIKAVEKISTTIYRSTKKKPKILITSAGGKPLTNAYAKALTKYKDVVIVCGRYEGIDARVKKILKADLSTKALASVEEVSVGPYILTGGEVPALAIIDATARQIKGVLGKFESLEESRVASHDVYTRPEIIIYGNKKYKVPKVLLSGHHARIDSHKSKRPSTSLGTGRNTPR